jgi:cold shock CspA family protein/ribosomal protein S18 acetylase RimI-like enzyme
MAALFAAYEPDAHGVPAEVVVEPLGPQHLDACVALAVQREGGDPAAWRTSLESALDATDRLTLVGLVDGQLAGYSTLAWLAPGIGHPTSAAPDGWYLLGLVVAPRFRRHGVGQRLTAERLRWLQGRTERVWYFASSDNLASIDLHTGFGFRLFAEHLEFPGVGFTGTGLLFGADLTFDNLEVAQGVVKFWKPEKGWGAISSEELPEGRDAFAHFSVIEAEGYRELNQNQRVLFRYHAAQQDSFGFVADWVRAIEE